MPKYTKYLQFDRKVKEAVHKRDRGCIFCQAGYHMEGADPFELGIVDIMHYIPKSDRGMGVEQNGAEGCRYHHGLLDNGNKGLREEMLQMFREHLQQRYVGWNEESLRFSKWKFQG